MRKFWGWVVDYAAIVTGITTLALLFVKPESKFLDGLTIAGAILCALYILRVLYLWVLKPKFDWYIYRGNFLRKVVSVVLLMPSLLACLIQSDKLCGEVSIGASQEFVYEPVLYSSDLTPTPTVSLKTKQVDPPLLWSVYYHFIDPGNQHITSTKSGRGWAGLIAILGVFLLNGLLVSSIVGWIDSRKEKWSKGEVRYRWFLNLKSHYVIVGGNDVAIGIVNQVLAEIDSQRRLFKPYILIQTSCDVESFRRELFSTLAERHQRRIIIYYGKRDSDHDIKALCVGRAKDVYIIGEDTRTDDVESYHDTMNMKALSLIHENAVATCRVKTIKSIGSTIARLDSSMQSAGEQKRRFMQALRVRLARRQSALRMTCRVMFEYQTSFSIFQFSEISGEIKSFINFKPFSYYEMWAQRVFINKEVDQLKLERSCGYLPLEGAEGITRDSDRYVHLFIVGMSRMGVAMAIEAAHLAHYPNYDKERKIRTKITFVDVKAMEEKEFFIGRLRELFKLSHWRCGAVEEDKLVWSKTHTPEGYDHIGGDFIDVEWEFVNGGIESESVQSYISSVVRDTNSCVTIAMCLPEPSRCLAAALYLDRDIYEGVNQILVYNRYGDSLISQMTHKGTKQINPLHNKLRPFGMASECYDSKIITDAERIAEMLGNEYGRLDQNIDEGEGLNKSDVAKWWSNIYAANSMWTKLRSIRWSDNRELDVSEIEALATTEHSRWNMEQLLLGYRPLTDAEQAEVMADIRRKNPKKGEMAHYDICSFEVLKKIDGSSIQYDRGLSKILPRIYAELNKDITK